MPKGCPATYLKGQSSLNNRSNFRGFKLSLMLL